MLLTACGIENIVYLEKPRRTYDTSDLNDLSRRYCEFDTANAANTANALGYFQGTEIYYRIYERESDCITDRAAIAKYNDDNPFSAAQYLDATKHYYRLETDQRLTRPLIGIQSSNVSVRFRLQDYGTPVSDPAQLTIAGVSQGIPQRDSRIHKRIFDRENIAIGDEDVQKASSSTIDAFWWINFYAVSYGYDTGFRPLYSSLEPLGTIKLEKSP